MRYRLKQEENMLWYFEKKMLFWWTKVIDPSTGKRVHGSSWGEARRKAANWLTEDNIETITYDEVS